MVHIFVTIRTGPFLLDWGILQGLSSDLISDLRIVQQIVQSLLQSGMVV
jgi:hypothetical protein